MNGEKARSDKVVQLTDSRRTLASVTLLLVVGLGIYPNSFQGVFLFDDVEHIVENSRIRSLWPLSERIFHSIRPVAILSLAINYAISGLHVWSYHTVNLAIHLAAAVTLFGIVRQTLRLPRLRDRYGNAATPLALTVALLWVVHPLQTEAVTYIIQRVESLMGLCYLISLYGLIRGARAPAQRGWYAVVILACLAGMATKAVMVTAPVVLLFYDAVFLSRSVRGALRARPMLYLGLAATWGMLIWLLVLAPQDYATNAGYDVQGLSAMSYARTQPWVLLHYLRLAFWPHPLILDYGPLMLSEQWAAVSSGGVALLSTLAIMALLGATGWALRRRPELGFLGTCFFLILAPTSSVIPLIDPLFEHRMYLPLAAVITLVVLGVHHGLGVLLRSRARLRRLLATALVAGAVVVYGGRTVQRNADYHDAVSFWQDVIAKRPANLRAYNTLADALLVEGRFEEAAAYATKAIQLRPGYADAHHCLGNALIKQGKYEEGMAHLTEALRLDPKVSSVHYNLGLTLAKQGRLEEAVGYYAEASQRKPDDEQAHVNLGALLDAQGRFDEALAHYGEALRINPRSMFAHYNLAQLFTKQGRVDEAIAHYRQALRIDPAYMLTYFNLARLFFQQGRIEESIEYYEEAVRLDPEHAEAQHELGMVLAQQGRLAEAQTQLSEAIRLKPDYADAHNSLGNVCVLQGELEQAVAHYEEALRLNPELVAAQQNLERVRAMQGQPQAVVGNSRSGVICSTATSSCSPARATASFMCKTREALFVSREA